MLKKVLLFLSVLCVFSSAIASEPQRVTDKAGLFTQEEIDLLSEQISMFQMSTAMDFVVLTSNEETEGASAQEVADAFYDNGSFGMGPEKSGLVYFLDMHNRIPYISTCGNMIRYMTDQRIAAAHEAGYDSLRTGRYALAVLQVMAAVKAFVYCGIPFAQYSYPAD